MPNTKEEKCEYPEFHQEICNCLTTKKVYPETCVHVTAAAKKSCHECKWECCKMCFNNHAMIHPISAPKGDWEIKQRKAFYDFYDKIHIDATCTNPDNVKMQHAATYWLALLSAQRAEMLSVQKRCDDVFTEYIRPYVDKELAKQRAELAEKMKLILPKEREVNYHQSYNEGKIDLGADFLALLRADNQ